jgi:hypothetical protein
MRRSLRSDAFTSETERRFAATHEVQMNEPPPIQQAGAQKREELDAVKEGAAHIHGMDTMKGTPQGVAGPSDTAVYTCVMHPEVHGKEPGKCPKCGMKLVKAKGGDGEGHQH